MHNVLFDCLLYYITVQKFVWMLLARMQYIDQKW